MHHNILDIDIQPRDNALLSIGASRDEFSAGLQLALTRLARRPPNELPSPAEIPIQLHGQERRLGDVAFIRIKLGPDAPRHRA